MRIPEKNTVAWMKMIYFTNKRTSYQVATVPMAPFDPKSTSRHSLTCFSPNLKTNPNNAYSVTNYCFDNIFHMEQSTYYK